MKSKISIVISLFNEEEGVAFFGNNLISELEKHKNLDFEILWVNDGSRDKTQLKVNEIITFCNTSNITNVSLEFSRNFGHEAAMIAGIDHATGDAIICMDGDGQHPQEEIVKMVEQFQKGNDFVLMRREQREDNSFVKKLLSSLFYKVINSMSEIKFQQNSSDFFLISRNIADILKENYREKNRFLRGFIQSLGFNSTTLSYIAPKRIHGQSSYSYKKLFKLAISAIFTFSFKPLRLSVYFAILFTVLTLILGGYSFFQYYYGDNPPSGYTTIILFLSFSFASLFSILSIQLMYFEKVIEEMRQSPLYIVKNKIKNEGQN